MHGLSSSEVNPMMEKVKGRGCNERGKVDEKNQCNVRLGGVKRAKCSLELELLIGWNGV